jgi:hypothetical protein
MLRSTWEGDMETESNGKWIIKKKFACAAVALASVTIIGLTGLILAETMADIAVLLTAYTTASGAILALIFAADITDKKLNQGTYDPKVKE